MYISITLCNQITLWCPGLDTINKKYRTFSGNLAKFSGSSYRFSNCVPIKNIRQFFSGICPASCTKKSFQTFFWFTSKNCLFKIFLVFLINASLSQRKIHNWEFMFIGLSPRSDIINFYFILIFRLWVIGHSGLPASWQLSFSCFQVIRQTKRQWQFNYRAGPVDRIQMTE